MTQPVQILGSFWTLAVGADPVGDARCHHDFRLRVETAAKAGSPPWASGTPISSRS